MKLIPGPFKDYYDHVAHMYGGGDARNTYHRKRIGKVRDDKDLPAYFRMGVAPHIVDNVKVEMKDWQPLYIDVSSENSRGLLHKWVVVAGKAYPLVSHGGYPEKLEVYDAGKHASITEKFRGEAPFENTAIGVQLPQLIDLSKKIGHPVFMITHDFVSANGLAQIYIHGECPVLRDLGFPSIYPADQMYQDLAYFMSNTMKESPDLSPRTAMNDMDKVASHGFDKKVSFRHRKEVPQSK